METPRRLEAAIDNRLRHPMVQRIEEPDRLAGMTHIDRQALQRARLAGEIRAIVDHGNRSARRRGIPHRVLLEQMHPLLPKLLCQYRGGFAMLPI